MPPSDSGSPARPGAAGGAMGGTRTRFRAPIGYEGPPHRIPPFVSAGKERGDRRLGRLRGVADMLDAMRRVTQWCTDGSGWAIGVTWRASGRRSKSVRFRSLAVSPATAGVKARSGALASAAFKAGPLLCGRAQYLYRLGNCELFIPAIDESQGQFRSPLCCATGNVLP
jgi:hypothetical protein